MDALKCPVCTLTMTASIRLCEKGHSVCGSCVKKNELKNCCLCNAPMTTARNYQLEDLVQNLKGATVKIPCDNAKLGCKHQVTEGQETEEHQAACRYRTYSCPGQLFCGWQCLWTGFHADILRHLMKVHGCRVLVFKDHLKTVLNFQERSEVSPVDYNEGQQLFLFKYRVDAERKKIFWVIQYVGPKDEAGQYYYEFEVFKGATRKHKVTEVCSSDVEDVEKLYEQERCASVSFAAATSFADESGALVYRYRVMKIKKEDVEDGDVCPCFFWHLKHVL